MQRILLALRQCIYVRTVLQQQCHTLGIGPLGGRVQRRPLVIGARIHIGTVLNEQFGNVHMVAVARTVQRCIAIVIRGIFAAAIFDEYAFHQIVLVLVDSPQDLLL